MSTITAAHDPSARYAAPPPCFAQGGKNYFL